MLLIVGLSVESGGLTVDALRQLDTILAAAGFRKEVSSVVKPGKEYSITYEGPNADKTRVEELLRPFAQESHINISIELEESVRFP